jgi:hypothetical protein
MRKPMSINGGKQHSLGNSSTMGQYILNQPINPVPTFIPFGS